MLGQIMDSALLRLVIGSPIGYLASRIISWPIYLYLHKERNFSNTTADIVALAAGFIASVAIAAWAMVGFIVLTGGTFSVRW